MTKLTIEQWPLARLKPYARDLRKHDYATVARMADLIRRYGMRLPLLVHAADGEIIDGKLRLKAVGMLTVSEANELGLSDLPVIPVDDLEPEEIKALRLALNRSAAWAPWDEGFLALELRDLEEMSYDLEATAIDSAELDRLIASLNPTTPEGGRGEAGDPGYREQYGVIVVCQGEAHQQEVYDELSSAGYECKVVVT